MTPHTTGDTLNRANGSASSATPPNTDPLPVQLEQLWRRQVVEWEMLREGVESYQQARLSRQHVDGAQVIVQCNAVRIRSASARVDKAGIAQRECFLCDANRPTEQAALAYRDGWQFLCNPAPLFNPHFTIVRKAHAEQMLGPFLGTLLDAARDLLGRYTVFYNGPRAGASAPDHAHFQAAPAGGMPFEVELAGQICGQHAPGDPDGLDWIRQEGVRIAMTHPPRRPAVIMISDDRDAIEATFRAVVAILGEVYPAEPEPKLNGFATYVDDRWIAWFHPRREHRPSFYGQDDESFCISPGAVDMGGILIVPRPIDFERMTPERIRMLYNEVLLVGEDYARLRDRLRHRCR